MNREIRAVILAAGRSTRMKSSHSKVLHAILGREIINYLVENLCECGISEENIIIVTGSDGNSIKNAVKRRVRYAAQKEPLGTAHALLCAADHIRDFRGDCLVTVGDNPYVSALELRRLIDSHRKSQTHCTFISAVFPHRPPPYGRVLRHEDGTVAGVVEEIDASDEQLEIKEVNASIYVFDNAVVFPLLSLIDNDNAKHEYYLTDIIRLLKERGLGVDTVQAADHHISIGINNRWELQEAQHSLNRKNLKKWALEGGVTVLEPDTITIEYGVEIGQDTVIFPSTYIAAGTRIGRNCRIGPFAFLKNTVVPDGGSVRFEERTGENSAAVAGPGPAPDPDEN
jgi:bifunctional UDP-N-acetylglucosamine pyrophosphorylase/glucosamine-1-phosphate N-acetyltransferase